MIDHSSPINHPAADSSHAAGVIRKWVEAINGGRPQEAAALYASDAMLLPTFSTHAMDNKAGRDEYFQMLASRQGLSVSLHEKTLRVRGLSDSVQLASGIYRCSFEIDGEPLTFEARFTWVMDFSKPRPIQHHHSSQVPRTLG